MVFVRPLKFSPILLAGVRVGKAGTLSAFCRPRKTESCGIPVILVISVERGRRYLTASTMLTAITKPAGLTRPFRNVRGCA